jgi:hypothetical protein
VNKSIRDMTVTEIMSMTRPDAEQAVAEQMKPYRDGLEKMLKFLEPKLENNEDFDADTCIAINFATNLKVGFTNVDLAGYLAAALYELATLRIRGEA